MSKSCVRHRFARLAVQSLERRICLAVDLYPTLQLAVNSGLGFAPGANVEGNAYLYNNGDTATPDAVAYRLVLAADSQLTSQVTIVENGTVPQIAPEANGLVNFSFEVPSGLVGRRMYLGIIADPQDVIDEGLPGNADEADNNNQDHEEVRFATLFTGDSIAGTDGEDDIRFVALDDVVYITDAAGTPESGVQVASASQFGSIIDVELKAGHDAFIVSHTSTQFRFNVSGGDGNDQIETTALNDTLDGGAGIDYLQGNFGDDVLSGGDGDDGLGGRQGSDTLDGGEGNDDLDGGPGVDSVHGNNGNDFLRGGDGDDQVWGDRGRDTLRGGTGNDRLAGGAQGDDLLGDEGNDTVIGNGGRDKLRGGAGLDKLLGGSGNDILGDRDTPGPDTLSGGTGNDESYSDAEDILHSIEVQHA